ncbi:MAG TPA: cob(I)yrinic acid a,c-diamide adenosyltransferase [Clostridia bacterium]|nr:cob(I)yrinic acid a,c-diamide adenosyltransferase [Clostridia bacterium]
MGHIYTKKGDSGETGLLGGSRISKDHLKVSCYGTLDEANAAIGFAYSLSKSKSIRESLREIQKKLFTVCAELACDDEGGRLLSEKIQASDIQALEQLIDRYEEKLGPLKAFIVPGGTTASAAIHVARTIIRRGERSVVTLDNEVGVRPELLCYINRLSDAMFMLAREEERKGFTEAVKCKVLERIGHFPEEKKLELETAKRMAEAAERKANMLGIPVVFAATDEEGNILLLHRMKGALPVSLDIAPNKAYTAAALRMPTHEVAALVQPGKELYGLQWTNQSRIVPFGGGFPLEKGGKIYGAVGISGGTVDEDMTIAAEALNIFKEERGI